MLQFAIPHNRIHTDNEWSSNSWYYFLFYIHHNTKYLMLTYRHNLKSHPRWPFQLYEKLIMFAPHIFIQQSTEEETINIINRCFQKEDQIGTIRNTFSTQLCISTAASQFWRTSTNRHCGINLNRFSLAEMYITGINSFNVNRPEAVSAQSVQDNELNYFRQSSTLMYVCWRA